MEQTVAVGEMTDDMDEQEYLAILAEIWKGKSLREVVGTLGSRFSTASWSKVARGRMGLNQDMKNELRTYRDLPEIPTTHVPEGVQRVVRVGGNPEVMAIFPNRKLTFRMNGTEASVIFPATRVVGPRKHMCVSVDTFAEANRLRNQLGVTWDDFMRIAIKEIRNAC